MKESVTAAGTVTANVIPAVLPSVRLSLTIVFTVLYSFLFFAVFLQLILILYYRHKRLSYQSVFLFLCLIWSGLRTTLFSFYFEEENIVLVNNLSSFWYWLLYCCPVCLQFLTLCLLTEFFTQMVFRAKARNGLSRCRKPFYVSLVVSVLLFTIVNIVCAIFTKIYRQDIHESVPLSLIYLRVIVNDGLFIVQGILLSISLYQLATVSTATLLLEARGTSKCQAVTACVFIVLLYTSRAIYNMLVVLSHDIRLPAFGYSWTNVSDQADIIGKDLTNVYVSFGVILFIWEFLPTFVVICFFRVRIPEGRMSPSDLSSRNYSNSRAYFFDNPRRYDSEESLAYHCASASHSRPSWHGEANTPVQSPGYSVNSPLARQMSGVTYGSIAQGWWQTSTGTPPCSSAPCCQAVAQKPFFNSYQSQQSEGIHDPVSP